MSLLFEQQLAVTTNVKNCQNNNSGIISWFHCKNCYSDNTYPILTAIDTDYQPESVQVTIKCP